MEPALCGFAQPPARRFGVDDPLSRDACGTQDSHQPSPVVCHCGKAVKGLSIWPAAVRIDVEILPPI
jgi:hypothetical protein